MTEKLDRDIRRALQAEAKDLTFTPEMRRRVLERIQAEVPAPNSPAVKTGRSPRSLVVPRPLLWTAVAAAALIIAFRLDLGGAGGHRTAMDSGAAKPEVAARAPAQTQSAPADSASTGAAASTEAPSTQPTPPEVGTGSQDAPSNTKGPNGVRATKEVPVVHLTAAAVAAAQADQPAPLPQGGAGIMGFAKVRPTIRLAILPAKDHVVELNTNGLRAVLPDGRELWNAPIPELSPEARLFSTPDGHYAVLSGNTVSLVNADGVLDQSITLADALTDLAFSPDGRLALAGATQVEVRKGDAAQFQVATGSPAYVAFAPNGTLAILDSREGQVHLVLRDPAGQASVDVTAPAQAHVLAVAGDNLVLAGGQAYDLTGSPLWALPFSPQGLSRVSDRIIAWDGSHAVSVDAKGNLQWQTSFDSEGLSILKVVPAADGNSLQILGATPAGGMVWAVSPTGEPISAQGTTVLPADATLLDGKLVILTQDSLTFMK